MGEGVVAVDKQERVIRLNQAALELFGITSRKYPGRPIQEVLRQAELQHFIRRALNQQEQLEDELVMHGQKKRYLHGDLSAQKMFLSGRIFGSQSREPAGIKSVLPLSLRNGRREPHSLQNTFVKDLPPG